MSTHDWAIVLGWTAISFGVIGAFVGLVAYGLFLGEGKDRGGES